MSSRIPVGRSRMPKVAVAKARMRAGAARREPDHSLARRPDVMYRLALRLRDPADAAGILTVLSESAISLGYLLLLTSSSAGERHAAYVGLGTAEVADLAIRLAARGILVERGEELACEPPVMRNRIGRCDPAASGATFSTTGAIPRTSLNRRKP
jgi:hypothetical protein